MKVISASDAAALVGSGQTLTVSGLIGNLVPELVLEALEQRFLETGEPRGLTQIHPWLYGGPNGTGLNRWAHPGFLKRIIGSTYILPALSKDSEINRFIFENQVEAYCWPGNAIFQMLRAVGARRPGYFTRVGLDTWVDPRRDGGRINEAAKEELIELVTLAGQEHLFYPSIPIDVALIKASTADTEGNLTCEDEGLTQGILLQATAAHNSGGIVIAQVRRVVEAGSMHPLMVEVPGVLVDYVVVNEAAMQWEYGANAGDAPATTGKYRMPFGAVAYPAMCPEKIIARRALQEITPNQIVNTGGGVPSSFMHVVADEEMVRDRVRWSVEHGAFGGLCLASTHWNPTAITSPGWLLDFYAGGGLDQSFLAFGEVDRSGNVNVGKLGGQLPGPGGFTDIATPTRKVSFCGTMTSGGLEIAATDGTLKILNEGSKIKFVNDCEMVCFSGKRALEDGHEIKYITERAVFRLEHEGLVLEEVAPGIDIETQVLANSRFPIRVSPDVKLMDQRLFREEPMFLHEDWGR